MPEAQLGFAIADELAEPDLSAFLRESVSWTPEYIHPLSAWIEHTPFAFWIVDALRPNCIVELGTHTGVSYLAFCQAVQRLDLASRCYAVDTWKGDEHTGFYGDEVFQELSDVHDYRYRHFSRLVRSTFDEAVRHFDDGSIDLLHIDGLHTYEAVTQDFETWRPKLDATAIVLFHDTNVRERRFEVFKLWRELARDRPHFEFLHGHGLGVLGIGTEFPYPITKLFDASRDVRATTRVRQIFSRFGAQHLHLPRLRQLSADHERLSKELAGREASVSQLESACRAEQATAQRLAVDISAGQARIRELESVLEAQRTRSEQLARELGTRDMQIAELRSATEQFQTDAQRSERDLSERDRQIGILQTDGQRSGQEVASRDARIGELQNALAAHASNEASLTIELHARKSELRFIKRSPSWRMTLPLRSIQKKCRGLTRKPGKLAKRAWRMLARSPSLRQQTASIAASEPPLAKGPSRPTVVFISGEPHTPGHVYRVENLRSALATRFFDSVVVRHQELATRLAEIADAQIVWIWRATYTNQIRSAIETARTSGAKVVYDVDDLMFRPDLAKIEIIDGIRSQGFDESAVAEMYAAVQEVVLCADHCTVPTSSLAQQLRHLYKPATVIPNGFDRHTLAKAREAYIMRRRSEHEPLVRIGYACGSQTHQRDFAQAARAIADILSRHDHTRLTLFQNTLDVSEFPELSSVLHQIEWRPLVPIAELPLEYARFDINIAPLELNNPFCEAKSELKFFEAALVGVPTVASPTRPYREAIDNGETGFLAHNEDEWREYIERLVLQPDLRSRLAGKAYARVLWRFGPERRTMLMTRLINTLLAPAPISAELMRNSLTESTDDLHQEVVIPEFDVFYASPRLAISRVSVVIPLYNYEQFIIDSLDSVKRQTLPDIDLIVVDDCSTDRSLETARTWLQENQARFNWAVLLKNRQNAKLACTRNVGISFADTEFVFPLDADNELLPECLERCISVLDETEAAVAYPTIELFGENSGRIGELDWDPSRLRFGNYIDAMSMVRKACWAAVGGYSPLEFGWEDYELWCKFAEVGFWGVRVPEVAARYRVHGSSMLRTCTDVPEKKARLLAEITARHPWLRLEPKHAAEFGSHAARDEIELNQRATEPKLRTPELPARLLDILRCPETGERLVSAGADALETAVTKRRWPVVDGRPVFTEEGPGVRRHPLNHLSNALPSEAVKIVENSTGHVLALSAGGTREWFPNVVEVEYSIFRNTDVVADAHRLPFHDESFCAVVCLNALEHYRDPLNVLGEVRRVLKCRGTFFLHTAFMQPLHEEPNHYFNCTKYGLLEWLRDFEVSKVRVSSNFNPVYAFSWLASDLQQALATDVSAEAASAFGDAPVAEFVALWRDETRRSSPLWQAFFSMPQTVQERFAAGWEAVACRIG